MVSRVVWFLLLVLLFASASPSAADECIDYTDYAQPLGLVDLGEAHAHDVDVVDTTAFVALGEGGLLIVDVVNPLAPISSTRMDLGVARGVEVVDGYAYVIVGERELVRVDVNDRLAPTVASRQELSTPLHRIARAGTRVFLSGRDSIRVLETVGPPRPRGLVAFADAELRVQGEHLYYWAGDRVGRLALADTKAERELSRLPWPDPSFQITGLAADGDYVLTTGFMSPADPYDLPEWRLTASDWASDPPRSLGSMEEPAEALALEGDLAVTSFGTVLDVTERGVPRSLGRVALESYASRVEVFGELLVFHGGGHVVQILPRSELRLDEPPVHARLDLVGVKDLAVGADRALAATRDGLTAIDLTDPVEPAAELVVPTAVGLRHVRVDDSIHFDDGRKLYVARSGPGDSIETVFVLEPLGYQVTDHVEHGGFLYVVGSDAYFPAEPVLRTFRLEGEDAPVETSSLVLEVFPRGLAVRDGTLYYVGSDRSGVGWTSLADPAEPTTGGWIEGGDATLYPGLVLAGDRLLVRGARTLSFFSVAEGVPVWQSERSFTTVVGQVDVVGDRVYVVDGSPHLAVVLDLETAERVATIDRGMGARRVWAGPAGLLDHDGRVLTLSPLQCSSATSVPVRVSSFTAEVRDARVRVSWRQAGEQPELGLHGHQRGREWPVEYACRSDGLCEAYDRGIVFGAPLEYSLRTPDGVEIARIALQTPPLVTRLSIDRIAPNPFNPNTRISFAVPSGHRARLSIVDLRGRRVATLFDAVSETGRETVDWHPVGLASGVYEAVLRCDGARLGRKLSLLK